jgi:hypothetical protein
VGLKPGGVENTSGIVLKKNSGFGRFTSSTGEKIYTMIGNCFIRRKL